jgi:hypothetical protein
MFTRGGDRSVDLGHKLFSLLFGLGRRGLKQKRTDRSPS